MSTSNTLVSLAGPAATIIASLTVATVTTYFAIKQAKTAADQAQIALDKVKIEVMKDRITVVQAVRALMRLVVNAKPGQTPDLAEAQTLQRTVDDGRYLFSRKTNEYLRNITNTCYDAMDFSDRDPGRQLTPDELTEFMKRNEAKRHLIREMTALPARLEEEISPTFILDNFHLRAQSQDSSSRSWANNAGLAVIGICALFGLVVLLFIAAVIGSQG